MQKIVRADNSVGRLSNTIAMNNDRLLQALRAATRPQHDEIESLLRLMEPLELPRYTAILRGFHTFLGHWEPRIQALLPAHLGRWWAPRRRRAFASADLRHLGASPGEPGDDPGQAVGRLALDALPQMFGSMYVIEGSALGGQVIAPKLQRELGLLPGTGASYFHGFGADTGAMWREFRNMLTHEVDATEVATQQACEAARATFQALGAHFRGLPA